MTTSIRRLLSGLAMLALLAGPLAPAWTSASARGSASRGSGSHGTASRGSGSHAAPRSSPGAASRSASRAAPTRPSSGTAATRSTATRTNPRQPASGRATYGHGNDGYYGGGYPGGWYGYGYPYWSLDFYWGWPYYGWGYPYYPYYPYGDPAGVYADPGPARIELDVTPRRATILLDGDPAGRVKDWDGRWDRLPVEPGERVLTFEAPGYKTLRIRVDAEPGRDYHIAYDLAAGEGIDSRSTSSEARLPQTQPAAPPMTDVRASSEPVSHLVKGFLRINVKPGDAAVYLDGEYFARADELSRLRGAVPLVVGTHVVEVVRPGYANGRIDVEIAADQPADVTLELQKNP